MVPGVIHTESAPTVAPNSRASLTRRGSVTTFVTRKPELATNVVSKPIGSSLVEIMPRFSTPSSFQNSISSTNGMGPAHSSSTDRRGCTDMPAG